MKSSQAHFAQFGYVVLRQCFSFQELSKLKASILLFHQRWLDENANFFQEKAINSAYLTGSRFLNIEERFPIFDFISTEKLNTIARQIMGADFAFMNTQLFFNPANQQQANYWHRDAQYHLSLEEQKSMLQAPEVVHFRVPLEDEPGLEIVPESHKNWDSTEELDVRLEQNGRTSADALSTGRTIKLQKGDLLIFSANLIHRGLYGKNRLAFDLLFCPANLKFMEFIDSDCLPTADVLTELEAPAALTRTIDLKAAWLTQQEDKSST